MPKLPMSALSTGLLALLPISIGACDKDSRPPKVGAPDRATPMRAMSPVRATAAARPGRRRNEPVSVTGFLVAFDPSFKWHHDGAAGHDDGVAPLATFGLRQPTMFRGRQVRVLFKYKQPNDRLITAKTPLKTAFTFTLPRGYFDQAGPVPLIDNSLVKKLALSAP